VAYNIVPLLETHVYGDTGSHYLSIQAGCPYTIKIMQRQQFINDVRSQHNPDVSPALPTWPG
jgi:hypothetical protein